MTIATLTRLIAILLVALCAPAGMCARVRGFNRVQLWLFAHGLAKAHARGDRLRYPGESLATVAARIDLHAWLACDVWGALRHLARRARGWRRARLGNAAPAGFVPPQVQIAPCVEMHAAIAFADSS